MNKKGSPKISQTFNCTKYVIRLIFQQSYGKLYLLIKSFLALTGALFSVSYTLFPGFIIDSLISKEEMITVWTYIGALLLTPVFSHIINSFGSYYLTKLSIKLSIEFDSAFYDHIMSMDYESFENPEIKILKNRASDTNSNILSYADLVFEAFSAIVSLIAIASVIATLQPFIILLVVLLVFLNSLVTKKLNSIQFALSKELSVYDNYDWGISYMIYEEPYAKEIRLYNIKAFLIDLYVHNKNRRAAVVLRSKRTFALFSFANIATNLIQQIVLYGYLIYRVVDQSLPIGRITIYTSAVARFSGALSRVFDSYLKLADGSMNLMEYLEFMSMGKLNSKSGGDIPVYDSDSIIEFKNVSFKYPGSDNYAIRNLNLKINGSEHLCIVGENGSGKSTFIKLLTRLYSPTDGEILLNGKNIAEYDYEKYLSLFAPVFQDFVHYYMSLEKNITLSETCDKVLFDRVCLDCRLNELAAKLPKGYATSVDKLVDPDGFRPSGGEDQRIAIARACYRGGNIYILDEPTAALDPVAEFEIYSQFSDMITNKCAVLITHRLSAVQLADKVAVFDNGSVVEYGTHKELYAKGGIYTEMFDKQAQFYRNANENDSDSPAN